MLTYRVSGVAIVKTNSEPLVSGTVGASIRFLFGEDWDECDKIATFEAYPPNKPWVVRKEDILLGRGRELVATGAGLNAMLSQPGMLKIGVSGTSGDDLIPTVFARPEEILRGAVPRGIEPPPPEMLVEQILRVAENAEEIALGVKEEADAGGFDGADGQDGQDGQNGQNGVTPHIGENGNWFIGDTDTGAPSQGAAGQDGADGVTPHIAGNGNWYVGDTDTGVHAQGAAGQDGLDGKDGVTPHIGDNGNWYVGSEDTGIHAQGETGVAGTDGQDGAAGQDGVGVQSAAINTAGVLVFTKTDGSTTNAGNIVQLVIDALPDGDEVSY